MILDRISNYEKFNFGTAWVKVFHFLNTLNEHTENNKYEIQGDDIYAQVMTYETKQIDQGILETHRKYADVQVVLAGQERVEWTFKDQLQVKDPYNPDIDAEFYHLDTNRLAHFDLHPGMFALFLPYDAHMPSLSIGPQNASVKKVVVKIRHDLLIS